MITWWEGELNPIKAVLKRRESVFYTQGEGGTPYDGLYWDPLEQRIFFRLRVYKRARGRGGVLPMMAYTGILPKGGFFSGFGYTKGEREGDTPYDGLYWDPPERGIFFRLRVYKREGGGGYSLRWPILGSSRKGDFFRASGIQKGRGRGILPTMAYTGILPKGGFFSGFRYTKGQGIQQQQQ